MTEILDVSDEEGELKKKRKCYVLFSVLLVHSKLIGLQTKVF